MIGKSIAALLHPGVIGWRRYCCGLQDRGHHSRSSRGPKNFLPEQLSQNRQALERFRRHIPLFRIFDDEVKRSVRVEKQLSLFQRGERPVALIDGGIDEHAGHEIALG